MRRQSRCCCRELSPFAPMQLPDSTLHSTVAIANIALPLGSSLHGCCWRRKPIGLDRMMRLFSNTARILLTLLLAAVAFNVAAGQQRATNHLPFSPGEDLF